MRPHDAKPSGEIGTSRRRFTTSSLLGLGSLAFGPGRSIAQPDGQKAFRIAHLTDVHLEPGAAPEAGFVRALHLAQSLDPAPDLILNGGDAIFDALKRSKSEVATQWSLWQKLVREECSLPIEHCIGNHDVWGWNLDQATVQQDDVYGKRWAQDVLGLERRHFSRAVGSWQLIVLDSVYAKPGSGYTARLDEEQFYWLREELRRVPVTRPVLIASHIPILAACAFFDGSNESTGDWRVPGSWMHTDARRLKDLFARHANVKAAISGHIHLQDEVGYLGVRYFCNGAVSGNWWDGAYQEFGPAIAVVDLHDDGTVTRQMIDVG